MQPFTPVHTLPIFFCGLLLPQDQMHKAIALNQKIGKYCQLGFSLDEHVHPPYLRMYETVLPDENITLAEQYVSELSEQMIPFNISWGPLEMTHEYVILWAENNPILQLFHQAVLEKINSLRQGHYKSQYAQSQHELTPQEQESLIKWGSPWVQPYLPHLVLAKTDQDISIETMKLEWEETQGFFKGMIAGVRLEDKELITFQTYPFAEYVKQKKDEA